MKNAFYIRPDPDIRGELRVPIRIITPLPNAPLHGSFSSNRYYLRFQVPGITPDLRVNGNDGPLTLEQTDNLRLSLSVQSNGVGGNSEWWLAADTPLGLWFWTLYGWTPLSLPAYSGPLFTLNSFTSPAIPLTTFPPGKYSFYFGVDMNMDGNVSLQSLYFDTVVINLKESR